MPGNNEVDDGHRDLVGQPDSEAGPVADAEILAAEMSSDEQSLGSLSVGDSVDGPRGRHATDPHKPVPAGAPTRVVPAPSSSGTVIAGGATFIWLAVFNAPHLLLLGIFVALLDSAPVIGSTIVGVVVAVALTDDMRLISRRPT